MNKKTVTYIVSWCSEGLEGIVPVTEIEEQYKDAEKNYAWRLLESADPGSVQKERTASDELNSIVQMMILRARFNPQRNYEIYMLRAVAGITEEDLREMFEQTPQAAADLIRERGTKLYSDRAQPNRTRIV